MKRSWILLAGALPLALATPADAGHGRGYTGPIIVRTSHQAGFIGAGHRVGTSHRFTGNHLRRNVSHVRGRPLNRGRFIFNRIAHRHDLHCGHTFYYRGHRYPAWQRFARHNPWFRTSTRDWNFRNDRRRNQYHPQNGKDFNWKNRFDRRVDHRWDRRWNNADSDHGNHGRKSGYSGRYR